MSQSTIHIVFSASAAVDLRQALTQVGRADRVISPLDCLSFGPINTDDRESRSVWVERELGYQGWEDVVTGDITFWRDALSLEYRKIAWFSRRSAQELSGFLAWHWKLGDMPFEFVDLTDVTIIDHHQPEKQRIPHRAISLGLLRSDEILANGLLDRTAIPDPALRDRCRTLWNRLRSENAPLRILADDELHSAPISFFDPQLLSNASFHWEKTALVVARALTDFLESSLLQTGDLVLASRIRALVEAGKLEARGDLSSLHASEVRLVHSVE